VLSMVAAACAWRSCRWLAWQSKRSEIARPDLLPPLVSLLVPARDEERNIEGCLDGLVAQSHPRCEILVLDDGSSDATAEIATRMLATYVAARSGSAVATPVAPTAHATAAAALPSPDRPPIAARLLTGRPLEPGWGGKCFACHQLAEQAQGDWLLFLDADTRLAPDGVARALAAAVAAGVDLASFLPRYGGEPWPNRLVVPWLYFFLTALVPLPEVTRLRHPRLAVANGQAILVRRAAYAAIGGHAAIRDHIVEDVSLAIAAKRGGLGIALLDGHRWLGCEMYDDARGLAAGFAKSFHSAARRYPLQWGALLTLLALIGFRPWLRLISVDGPTERTLALISIVVVGATFAGLLVRFRQRLSALAVWPLALWSLLVIAVAGGVSGLLGRELAWRGRPVGGGAPS
jgi:chlorobactene glucosyltransferase